MKTESSRPTRTFEIVKGAARSARDFIGDVAIDPDEPSALRLRSVSRRDRGGEYAIRHRDRSIQNRTPALSHSVQSRWQIVLRHQLGRWLAVSSSDQQRRSGADSAAGRASHRHGLARPCHSRGGRREAGEAAQQPSFKARIFVSAANTNNVYSVGVSDSGDLRVVETINVSTTPNHPLGHDAQRAGAESRSKPSVCGLLGRQCRRGSGRYRSTQPGARLRSNRLVSHGRAVRWPTAAWWC